MSQSFQKLSICRSIDIKRCVKESISDRETYKLAGFVNDGKFAWIAYDSILRVLSTDTGAEIAYYNFGKHHGTKGCIITCVEEIKHLYGSCILAIGIEFTNGIAGVGMLSIFSVQGSKILGSMDMAEKITCLRCVDRDLARNYLLNFNGIIAVGTEQGKLFFVDLMLPKNVREILQSPSYDSEIFPMYNVKMEPQTSQEQIYTAQKRAVLSRQHGENCFFTIQLKDPLDESGAILSILTMPNALLMSVGLDDGRMILFDLVELEAFHLAYPPGKNSPLTHMCYIEPIDDPRAVVYVWAFHASRDGAIAVLHSIVFESIQDGTYEEFKSCCVRLTIPMTGKDTFPVSCISISKPVKPDDDDYLKICFLTWCCAQKKKTYTMVFDLNQWYRAQLPSYADFRNYSLKYAVVFEINDMAMDISCDTNMLTAFDSIERPEEHFLPTSLSFNVTFLESKRFTAYQWCGIQKQALEKFKSIGPMMILSPSFYFNEMLQASIRPQFYDNLPFKCSMNTPMELKRDFLLSVALEYNYVSFLKNCAVAWSDGSMLAGDDVSSGVGLSTLTDWICKRVRTIKEASNELCKPLFDYSHQRIDCGTQKQLSSCFRQLKILSDLLHAILTEYKSNIPNEIQIKLEDQSVTIKMAAEYQEVVQWLLNVGLLPEGHDSRIDKFNEEFIIVPYPYKIISNNYQMQREKLTTAAKYDSAKYLLFIDAFIHYECGEGNLEDVWGCSYPPKSLQTLLRTLLVENITLENKCVILMYIFMDISLALNNTRYSNIVKNLSKFPTVFKIPSAVIKRTQAYWNLDNGNLDVAVDEIISPLANDRYLPRWNRELLICVLLKRNANVIALKALRCPGSPIQPALEIETLLANDLVSEALHVQRRSGDRELLERFYDKVLNSHNYGQLLDLALTEDEGKILREFLENADLSNCVNLHFVFLLQRSKFIDATELMNRINQNDSNLNLEPPKQILNAFYSTMESTTQKLFAMPEADKSEGSVECPSPLSNNVIKLRSSTNNFYKRCIQSINNATFDGSLRPDEKEMPFIGTPRLGIFEYRQNTLPRAQEIKYVDPDDFNDNGKRRLADERSFIDLNRPVSPKAKKRRVVEEVKEQPVGSFINKRILTLTRFRNSNPRSQSRLRSISSTPQFSNTPQRTFPLAEATNFLATPIVKERTPPPSIPERCPGTPHSILKTRSNRGSVSPSRFSEYDDNKSVKSITFAMPSTRESSIAQDSSYLDDSFGGANQESLEGQDSSASEIYFSPEKQSPMKIDQAEKISYDGPKPRQPLARSLTPKHDDEQNDQSIAEETKELNESTLATSILHKDVLESSVQSDSDGSELENTQDKSKFDLVRKSVIPDNYDEMYSDSSSVDEQEEENESSEVSSSSDGNASNQNEIIEIPDSDDDVVENESDVAEVAEIADSSSNEVSMTPLPSISSVIPTAEIAPMYNEYIEEDKSYAELQTNDQVMPVSQERMIEILYEDVEEMEVEESSPKEIVEQEEEQIINDEKEEVKTDEKEIGEEPQQQFELIEHPEEDIESPPYEEISSVGVLDQQIQVDESESLIKESIALKITQESAITIDSTKIEPNSSFDTVEMSSSQESTLEPLNQAVISETILNEAVFSETILNAESKIETILEDENELNQAVVDAELCEETNTRKVSIQEQIINKDINKPEVVEKIEEISKESKEVLNESPEEPKEILEISKESQNEDYDEDKEIEEVLKNALGSDNENEVPELDKSKEEAIKEPKVKTRGTSSVPRASSVPLRNTPSDERPSRVSRAVSELRKTPQPKKKSKQLENIEEILNVSIDSPGRLTRRQSQLLRSRESTPVNVTQSTRGVSQEVETSTKSGRTTPSTSSRMLTRALSKDGFDKTPERPKSSQSRRLRKTSTDENLNQSTQESEDLLSTSLTNRRLTRSQLAVLEKSRQSMSMMVTRSADHVLNTSNEDDPNSGTDNESIKSGKSGVSSKSKSKKETQSRKRKNTRSDDNEDATSVSSKTSRKSTSPTKKGHQLSAIPEEGNEDANSEKSFKSGRRTKRKT